jgi:hypothetical protein
MKLEQSLMALQAVCGMLRFTSLSEQTELHLLNLKRLLELEISALRSQKPENDGDGGDSTGEVAP